MGWKKKSTIGTIIGLGILPVVYFGVKKERERIIIDKELESIPYDFDKGQYKSSWWGKWTYSLKSNFIQQKKR